MGRIINFVYGTILLLIAIEALWTDYIPNEFLPYAVLLMGVVILFTPITRRGLRGRGWAPHPRPFFDYLRRYVFGLALILMGVASAVPWLQETFIASSFIDVSTRSGSLILAAIAAIYFLSAFKPTRTFRVESV